MTPGKNVVLLWKQVYYLIEQQGGQQTVWWRTRLTLNTISHPKPILRTFPHRHTADWARGIVAPATGEWANCRAWIADIQGWCWHLQGWSGLCIMCPRENEKMARAIWVVVGVRIVCEVWTAFCVLACMRGEGFVDCVFVCVSSCLADSLLHHLPACLQACVCSS